MPMALPRASSPRAAIIEAIAAGEDRNVPAMKGWRRKLFGETALEIRAGRSAIGLKNGRQRHLSGDRRDQAQRRRRITPAVPRRRTRGTSGGASGFARQRSVSSSAILLVPEKVPLIRPLRGKRVRPVVLPSPRPPHFPFSPAFDGEKVPRRGG